MSKSVAVAISVCSILILIALIVLIVALVLYCKYYCCKKKETPTGEDSARELLDLERNIAIQTDLIDEDAYNERQSEIIQIKTIIDHAVKSVLKASFKEVDRKLEV